MIRHNAETRNSLVFFLANKLPSPFHCFVLNHLFIVRKSSCSGKQILQVTAFPQSIQHGISKYDINNSKCKWN